jgi:hypothetical protein
MAKKLHSKLGASSMERWSVCPGSVALCEGMESISSAAADEGTLAHDYAEQFLRGDLPADKYHKLAPDMQEAIKLYADTIFDDMQDCEPFSCELVIEHEFDLSSVFPGCFGTADAVVWNPNTRVLRVYDFKYGKGHWVDVEENLQLQYYGLGALVTLKYPALYVELVIVQPRCTKKTGGKVRKWRIPAMRMLDFEAFLVERAEATTKKDAELVPGRHCFWCPAHTKCPAKTAERLSKAMDSFDDLPDEDEDDPFAA